MIPISISGYSTQGNVKQLWFSFLFHFLQLLTLCIPLSTILKHYIKLTMFITVLSGTTCPTLKTT